LITPRFRSTLGLASGASAALQPDPNVSRSLAHRLINSPDYVSDCSNQFQVHANQPILPATATSGMLKFPSAMPNSGNSISVAAFNLNLHGIDGENSIVVYQSGNCP
jgi:hypothetical protein